MRLRLRIGTDDVWATWCALQTRTYPETDADGSPFFYRCVPSWSFNSDGNGTCRAEDPATSTFVPVDCGKWALCEQENVGTCTADSCTMNTGEDGMPDIGFDMQLGCDWLDGSAAGTIVSLGVHLVRQG